MPQSVFARQAGAEFRYLLSSERGAVIERLRACLDDHSGGNKHLAPLEEFLSICRGEELGKESPWLTEIVGQSSASMPAVEQVERSLPYVDGDVPLVGQVERPRAGRPQGSPLPYDGTASFVYDGGRPNEGANGYYPVLRGGIDIHSYSVPHTYWQIARNAVVKPLERYVSPKLLIVKSTDRLQAALDLHGHVALQTLYLLHLRDKSSDEDALYFFLALLNSRLLRDYVYILHTAYKWVQPQIEQHVLACLPIPVVGREQRQQVIERARKLVSACSKSRAVVEWDQDIIRLYEEQERAICALYNSVLPGLFGDKGVIVYG